MGPDADPHPAPRDAISRVTSAGYGKRDPGNPTAAPPPDPSVQEQPPPGFHFSPVKDNEKRPESGEGAQGVLFRNNAFAAERPIWERVQRLGGTRHAVAMDEPLCCAREQIHKPDDYAVQETADFVARAGLLPAGRGLGALRREQSRLLAEGRRPEARPAMTPLPRERGLTRQQHRRTRPRSRNPERRGAAKAGDRGGTHAPPRPLRQGVRPPPDAGPARPAGASPPAFRPLTALRHAPAPRSRKLRAT